MLDNFMISLKATWIRRMVTKSNKYLNLVSELYPFTINISNFGCDFVKLQLQICFGFKCLKVLLK